ncbi:MAG: ABC transporter ATP-binding protein [Chloroflexi bacterium HGW-Chloroflexi-4]|jgi:simple sugar transport system ATP-binding protein|nr:MAG: ABC transporter ATP-binding protein [Chloroflexi bacterium HGW-Chloroflexi-7]PKN97839.1 MAG: ABC transporter ATP-binding protein [Chloroflexi bacterium HGW-Chloroflexi-4]
MDQSAILEMRGVNKTFDKVTALSNVDFELKQNEILGLLGGNGAGKTTLMNILFGLYKMDSGKVLLNGQPVTITSPRDALQKGIGMVHQHFLQINNFTVIENIVLGSKVSRPLSADYRKEEEVVQKLCAQFGLEIDLSARIETLPMGTRQKVEILKALYRGVKVLILDEPTTNLIPQEVDSLFQTLKIMVKEGLSIVFITHKLREVLSVCDRISVLREGKNVISLTRKDASDDMLVRAMVGEGMDLEKSVIFTQEKMREQKTNRPIILKVKGVSKINPDKTQAITDIDFSIHEGEVFGVAGVAGNGQRDLAEVIMGIQAASSGSLYLGEDEITTADTKARISRGFVYIPEDRLADGFLNKVSVAYNLILGYHHLEPYSKNGIINWKNVKNSSKEMITEYSIKTTGPEEIGGNLSGGNIQRVMIARAFSQKSKLLIAHNLTRGLDIPSMDFVYKKVKEQAATGMASLVISEDLDELLLICDRIAVMYRGKIVGILSREKFEKYEIGRLMSGYEQSSEETGKGN